MISEQLKTEILDELEHLSPKAQREVLDFARQQRSGLPPGISGKDFVKRFAGSIKKDDVAKMITAIEEGCERIDEDAWK